MAVSSWLPKATDASWLGYLELARNFRSRRSIIFGIIFCNMFIHETWQNTSTDMRHMCFPDTRGMYAKCWPIVRTSTTCGISPCLQHPCGQVRYRSYDMCGPFNHSTIAQNCRPMFPPSPVHLSSVCFLVIKCDNKADASGFFHVYTGCIRMYSI